MLTPNFLNRNLAAIKEHQPSVYDSLFPFLEISKKSHYTSIQREDQFFDIVFGSNHYYGNTPKKKVEEDFNKLDLEYVPLPVFFGFGLGYLFEKVWERCQHQIKKTIIFEADPFLFIEALKLRDFSQWFAEERIVWFVGPSEKKIRPGINEFFIDPTLVALKEAVDKIHDYPNVKNLKDNYQRFDQIFYQEINFAERQNKGTDEDAYQGFMNSMANISLSKIFPLHEIFSDLFKNETAIIVGSGPSLNKNIEWLKKIGNKAFIASTDSCYHFLKKNKIQPHLVGTVERVPTTQVLFDPLDKNEKAFFVTTYNVWPETAKLFKKNLFFVNRAGSQAQWYYDDQERYGVGLSVTHFIYLVLVKMGFKRILLVGQDHAYDRNVSQTHAFKQKEIIEMHEARNLEKAKKGVEKNSDLYFVTSNLDDRIPTTPLLKYFLSILENFIIRNSAECYNVMPKEFGAKIYNATQVEPEQAFLLIGEKETDYIKLMEKKYNSPAKNDYLLDDATIEAKTIEAYEHIKQYQKIMEEVLEATSLYFHRHLSDYSIKNFRPLFERVEMIASQVFDHDFYDYFFQSQIKKAIFDVDKKAHEILKKQNTIAEHDRVSDQVHLVFERFQSMLLWATRYRFGLERRMPALLERNTEGSLHAN